MGSLRLVELQGTHEAVDDTVGHARRAASFEARVVVGRHTGEERDLLPPQARDTSARPAVGGEPGLLGRDPVAAGAEELADLRTDVAPELLLVVRGGHAITLRALVLA